LARGGAPPPCAQTHAHRHVLSPARREQPICRVKSKPIYLRSQDGEDGQVVLGVALLLRVQEQKRGGAGGEMLFKKKDLCRELHILQSKDILPSH